VIRLGTSFAARGLRVEAVGSFPLELEPRLLERRRPLAMHRSAAWLDWIVRESFVENESHRRALYLVRDSRDEVVAYFLVKARLYDGVTEWGLNALNLGSLIDWQIFEPGALGLSELVLLALRALGCWRVGAVEVCVPPDADGLRLRRWGFRGVREQHVMLHAREGSSLSRQDFERAERWSVRPGEGDHAFS
jgi:hypothetical protein